ncbi:hypothetical protein ACH5RR_039987 [Cinchona calisaya]|uniref:Core-2/I-branching beta-1,6-N-acetylglucosaminyltransferase family protein n=1 Tax=Cinchona calisaya TaxID=153742 RepID=A0ABD2XZX1_9GENT
MLSPTPFSLLCALLLCLPLAMVFTITTSPTPHSSSSTTLSGGSSTSHLQTITTTTTTTSSSSTIIANKTAKVLTSPQLSALLPPLKTSQKPHNKTATRDETDDEDDSLFQLAGRVNPNPKPPIKKIAFMFLTTTPLPLAPLWELFFNKTRRNLYNIYIHADPSYNYTPPFRGVFAHRVIPSKPTRRHSPTLISAARRLLARALLHDRSNYMFALLSPSCIPLHSFGFTYRVLTKSRKSFVEILKDEPGAYDRWAARGEDAMVPEVKFDDFRIGSQFFLLKRKHARIVVRDSRLWSKFKLPCLMLDTCYPEEHYFATLLSMVDPRGCVPATLTHVDWRDSQDGHPRMYDEDEVGPELIRTLRKAKPRYGSEGSNVSNSSVSRRRDPFLFARKFSPDTIQKLMDIAGDIILKD